MAKVYRTTQDEINDMVNYLRTLKVGEICTYPRLAIVAKCPRRDNSHFWYVLSKARMRILEEDINFKLVIKKKKGIIRLNNTETINYVDRMVEAINRKINVASMMLGDTAWKNLPIDMQRKYQGLEKALRPLNPNPPVLKNSKGKAYSPELINLLERMTS